MTYRQTEHQEYKVTQINEPPLPRIGSEVKYDSDTGWGLVPVEERLAWLNNEPTSNGS